MKDGVESIQEKAEELGRVELRKRIGRLRGRQARIALCVLVDGRTLEEALAIAESYKRGH